MEGLAIVRAIVFRLFTYHPRDRGAIKVEVIRRREQAVRSVLWKVREDDDKREHKRERREDWYGSRPSEGEAGVEGGEAHVCRARHAVGAFERRLDERL